jgi:hypothetical protein
MELRKEGPALRRLHFDPFEFDSPDSEEELDLVIGTTEQFRDVAAFAHGAGITGGKEPSNFPLSELSRCGQVLDHVRRFAGLELPCGGNAQTIVLLDDWDDLELVVVAGRYFVWYHWSTTA